MGRQAEGGLAGSAPVAALEPPPGPSKPTLSVCCLTNGSFPARTAAILGLLRDVADEIVVGFEESRSDEVVAGLGATADRLVSHSLEGAGDRLIPWLFAHCRGDWVFNIDDDEVPGEALIARLPALVAADHVTHHWISRRWLFGDPSSWLEEPPWHPEYQLRLFRSDPRFVQLSDEFHLPVVAHGPKTFVDAPLWHLDFVLSDAEWRRSKAFFYEHERRGMRLAGVSHNTGLYLPELREAPRLAAVPPGDLRLIRQVLAGERTATWGSGATVEHTPPEDVERHWPGAPFPDADHHGHLELRQPLATLRAGVQQTVDVQVENTGDRRWRWGREGRPEIRIGYHWNDADGRRLEEEGLRTELPSDLGPGESMLVPVHVVAPAAPGRYILEIDLVHEHVRWFDTGIRTDVRVLPAPRVALAGDPEEVSEALDLVALVPEVEPLVLEADWPLPPMRYGHERVPGLRSYLGHGAEQLAGVRLLSVLLRRTRRIRAAARARRRAKPVAPLGRGADAFLEQLSGCELLILAGRDWPAGAALTRELWRLATTVLVAHALGVDVVSTGGLPVETQGLADWLLLGLVRRRSSPVDAESLRRRLVSAVSPDES